MNLLIGIVVILVGSVIIGMLNKSKRPTLEDYNSARQYDEDYYTDINN